MSSPHPLQCPRGHGPLLRGTGLVVDAHACRVCGGVWLSGAADDAVGAAVKADFSAPPCVVHVDADAAISCPVCHAAAHRFSVGVVEIDHCAHHGTWYDASELQAVRAHLQSLPASTNDDGVDDAPREDEIDSEGGHDDAAFLPPALDDAPLELARAPTPRAPPAPRPSSGTRAEGSALANAIQEREDDRALLDAFTWGGGFGGAGRIRNRRQEGALSVVGAVFDMLD